MTASAATAPIGSVTPSAAWKSDRRAISRPARSIAVRARPPRRRPGGGRGERNTEVIESNRHGFTFRMMSSGPG